MGLYVKLNLVTGDVLTQTRIQYIETQFDQVVAAGTLINSPEVRAPRGTYVPVAISGGNVGIDFHAGDWHEFTVNANWDFFFVNLPTGNKYAGVYIVTVGNGSDFTDGLAALGAIWPGNLVPTVTTTLNKRDKFLLIYNAAYSQWFGYTVGQNL